MLKRPNKFRIVKVQNALFAYECERLIQLYNKESLEFIYDFYGFDVEYINLRIEDIVCELSNLDVIYQEPIYITKTPKIGITEPNRSDAWADDNPLTKQYGNRVFSAVFFLTNGTITFPNIKLQHEMKAGDALIWNNVVEAGRALDSINHISNDTYYVKKWVREKPFI